MTPPRADRAAARRPHDAAEAAGDDRRAAARQQLADLLGPFEDPVRLRPARVAVADHRDARRALRDAFGAHAAIIPHGTVASGS